MENYIKDFLSYIEYEKKYSETTVTTYRCELNLFNRYLFDKNLTVKDLTNRSIRKYLSMLLQTKLSIRTVRIRISRINVFLGYLKQKKIINTNPVFAIRLPKPPKLIPFIVTQKTVKTLVEHSQSIHSNFKEIRDNIIIQLLFQTGIRRSELVGLKLKDIDFNEKQLKVLGKRKKDRIIPFGSNLFSLLQSYILKRNEEFGKNIAEELILTLKGKPITSDGIYVIVKAYLSKMDISKNSPHALRHLFATQLHENGSDIQVIKELLGHSHISTTQIYTHVSINSMVNSYKKFFLFKNK